MKEPELLDSLPKMSDIIPIIEKHIISEHKVSHGLKGDFEVLHDGSASTPGLCDRGRPYACYVKFLHAGSNAGLLPYCAHCTGANGRVLTDDELPTSYSPLAMQAARDICLYKRKPSTPDDLRQLSQAMIDSAKAEMEALLREPEGLLDHINRNTLGNNSLSRSIAEAGQAAAEDVLAALHFRLHAIAVWSDVLAQLDRVDWDDGELMMALIRNTTIAKENCHIPLCRIVARINQHQSESAALLSTIFLDHWDKGQQAPGEHSAAHKALHARMKQENPMYTERYVQARSLDRTTRFERALIRLCLPDLHPVVPFEVSMLDFEQQLRERPTRSDMLSDTLLKAIGYHAMVMQASQILHFRMVTIFAGAELFDDAALFGRIHRHYDKRDNAATDKYASLLPEPPNLLASRNTIASALKIIARRYPTSRDERVLWFGTRLRPVNWAEYVTINSIGTGAALDGRKLKQDLDALASRDFGCDLLGLMDHDDTSPERWNWLLQSKDYDRDAPRLLLKVVGEAGEASQIPHRCVYEPAVRRPAHQSNHSASTSLRNLPAPAPAPLTQSGHAYLRDNPAKERTGRADRSNFTTDSPARTLARRPRTLFTINNKQLKVAERLFGYRGGAVKWAELVNLFKRLGFSGMGGSAHHLTPISNIGRSMIVYRPHPDPTFTSAQAGAIGRQLVSIFGWSIDNFARSATTEEHDQAV